MELNDSIGAAEVTQNRLYSEAAEKYGLELERLGRAYEADPEKRRDLLQEIHFQLWRSLQRFDARCSIRTWVYRVAHNVAASHVIRERRTFLSLVSIEELEWLPIVLAIGALVVPQMGSGFGSGGTIAKMSPFLTLFALWIIGVFVIRRMRSKQLQREIEELNDIERDNRL